MTSALDDYEVHPLAAIFPMLSDEELADLAEDIKENGLLHPIVRTVHGVIVDGRNRVVACDIAGVEPEFEDRIVNDDEARALIISANLQRRNLTKGQQAMALALLHPEPKRGAHSELRNSTREFDKAYLSRARAILRHSEVMARSVLAGALSIDKALDLIAERATDDAKPEEKIAALRNRYSDLAAQVTEGALSLEAAEVEASVRDRQEVERRDTMVRLTDYALRGVTSWASDEFVSSIVQRMADPEFRAQLDIRIRVDPEQFDNIIRGAEQLLKFLRRM
jgi:ParB-like chromosome segregation protein Spo0J